MKKKTIFLLLILVFAIYSFKNSFDDHIKKSEGQQLIQTKMLDSFEKNDSWVVKYSKFRKHTWKDTSIAKYEPSVKWMTWKKLDIKNKDYRFTIRPEPPGKEGFKGTTIMGVRGKFYIKGYNWIVVEPKQDLFMMGKVKNLRVWVWGGNYDYDLYAEVKDYNDVYYKVHLGSLKFKGWKQLAVNLLSYNVVQFDPWVPQQKPLRFMRFLIMSKISEKPDFFGIWFDDLEYDTDLFDPIYAGKSLESEFDWE